MGNIANYVAPSYPFDVESSVTSFAPCEPTMATDDIASTIVTATSSSAYEPTMATNDDASIVFLPVKKRDYPSDVVSGSQVSLVRLTSEDNDSSEEGGQDRSAWPDPSREVRPMHGNEAGPPHLQAAWWRHSLSQVYFSRSSLFAPIRQWVGYSFACVNCCEHHSDGNSYPTGELTKLG